MSEVQEKTQVPIKLLLTVEEAARMLNVSRATFYPFVMRGAVASIKIGAVRRIPYAALEVFVQQLLHEQCQQTGGHV
jgi:excisionase family DNA binding protein